MVNVGSNNTFSKNSASSENIIKDYTKMIKSLKSKTKNAIVVGVFTRVKEKYNLSRAI